MKRVRKDVCHVWAHRLQSEARYGNISFERDTIYSYAAPIARHVTTKGKTAAILFTIQGYSGTTSCHKTQIREAIPDAVPVFEVPEPIRKPCGKDVKIYANRIAVQSFKVTRAKCRMPDELRELTRLVAEANKFCESFGFKRRFEMPANIDEMTRLAADHQAANNRKSKAESAKRRRDESNRLKVFQERLQTWLEGHEVQLPYMPDNRHHMRIVGSEVQTTLNAVIPVKYVKRVAKTVLALVRRGAEWHRNGETVRVGKYQLDRVYMDGTVVIGCHRFAKSEIERIAGLLGIK